MSTERLIIVTSGLVILFLASVGLAEEMLVPGDTSGDGVVSGDDLLWVTTMWGQQGDSIAHGNVNSDGIVNAADYNEVLANWGKFWEPMPESVAAQLYPETVEPAPTVQPIRISPIRITAVRLSGVRMAAVPEPAMLGLLVVGSLIVLARRH